MVMDKEEKALKSEGSWAIGAGTGVLVKGTELYAQVQAVPGHATRSE
jgi:hypothetical protein